VKKLNIVVALPGDNNYLREQAEVAEATAKRLDLTVQVINAHSDPVGQSQQLLEIIQSQSASRPDAIIVEPVNGMGLPRVAEAAVAAGIGWVISNARVDYPEQLRKLCKSPVFSVSQDHGEVGRIQGRQFATLLPEGGTVLYLRGPAMNSLACQRAEGLEGALPRNVLLKTLKIQWTEESCFQSVNSWLRLSTVHAANVHLIASQNTDFVLGARRAFQGLADPAERAKWLAVPCIGAGTISQIRPLVDKGTMTAGAVTSVTVDTAMEMVVRALQSGMQPPEQTFVQASSYPSVDALKQKYAKKQLAPVPAR
jgi:ABC-type sugar transport system substrate-binding protein